MNRATLIGNVGSDAELKYIPNGTAVCTFSLATSEKQKEEWVSTWHRIVVWGSTAEAIARRVKKGNQVFCEGKIQNREYEKNGQKVRASEVVAFMVKIIEKQAQAAPDAYAAGQSFQESDIPF